MIGVLAQAERASERRGWEAWMISVGRILRSRVGQDSENGRVGARAGAGAGVGVGVGVGVRESSLSRQRKGDACLEENFGMIVQNQTPIER